MRRPRPNSNPRNFDSSTTVNFNETTTVHVCQMCLEQFDKDTKPPKFLPCGHNFCENCLFMLCLHREYYLLDTVKCPKCESTFDAQHAMNAPTNLDLCSLLETTQSSQNITVIHVGNQKESLKMGKTKRNSKIVPIRLIPIRPSTTIDSSHQQSLGSTNKSQTTSLVNTTSSSSNASSSVEFVVDLQDNCQFCFDCRRYIDQKERAILCRFCQRCHGKAKKTRLTCLECCVNRHNGHLLRPIEELEVEQERLINDLHALEGQCQKFIHIFHQRLSGHNLTSSGSSEFLALDRAQKLISGDLGSCIKKAYSRIRSEGLLHPNEIGSIRQRPFILLARLQRLANLLEQALGLPKPNSNPYQSTTELFNQPQLDFAVELRQALQSLCTLTAVQSQFTPSFNDEEESTLEDIRQYIVILCSNECAAGTRADVLKNCIKALNNVLYGLNRPELLLLFADAYLNCFIVLNLLNPRRFGGSNPSRDQTWKLIQAAYSELLRLGGLQWPNANENRLQIVADFARLCALFADVCDSSTLTLCMIESAKVRASFNMESGNQELGSVTAQLEQIDEHLLEIRRAQKLAKICVRTRLKRRRNSPWLSCFSTPRVK